MSSVMFVLAFVGSIVAYCTIVFVLSAIINIIETHQSVSDNDFWFEVCCAQFAIALVVLAIYFANKMTGVS